MSRIRGHFDMAILWQCFERHLILHHFEVHVHMLFRGQNGISAPKGTSIMYLHVLKNPLSFEFWIPSP